ncbi:TetR/AcrR family transcriptional regulator [Bacillus niameyensis]|uniref:TetR/AcrR family transcriptional regulator n=1 Tax=Bacillus niameyensis TaxID=1522308 RepID=UPI00078077B5|nr:TetR/AcrR family transcriptional regulator [Bacillus niameyensis]
MSEEHNTINDVLLNQEGLTEKQRKILAAATEAFAEKGFAATSTSEIAKKAGVAEGTIFRHYKTKKDLLMTIVSPMMVKLIGPIVIKELNKVLDQKYDHFEDFLKAMVENRRKFLENNMAVIRILLQEIPFHAELREQFIEQIGKKVYSRFSQIVAHYQSKGQIIDMDPDTVIRLVASALLGFFVTKYVISPENWNDEVEINRTLEFLKNGLAPKE